MRVIHIKIRDIVFAIHMMKQLSKTPNFTIILPAIIIIIAYVIITKIVIIWSF